jgi:hypothetical protein
MPVATRPKSLRLRRPRPARAVAPASPRAARARRMLEDRARVEHLARMF